MSQQDITQTETITSSVEDFSVETKSIDGPQDQKETYWYFNDWTKNFGYYSDIPEYHSSVNTYATWVLGKGFTANNHDKVILENIRGWGKDSIHDILWNMLVVKKVNGDSFAEIIRNEDTGTLINLKTLDPEKIRLVIGRDGIIIRYDYMQSSSGKWKPFDPDKILHLCNDRIANQIHGTAASEAAKWVIDARHEMMEDVRRVAHRSTIRVLYVEESNKTRRFELKRDYAEAIKKGEVLILPGKPNETGFQDLTMPPTQAYLELIKYYENVFYQVVGVPKSATGGTQDSTEAGSKVGLVAFDPNYIREITDLQLDLWNQLALKLEFVGQKSMMDNVQSDQAKNTSQTGFQSNDTIAGRGE